MNLDDTNVTGTIPFHWFGMRKLDQLFLSNVKLHGAVPYTLCNVDSLVRLDLLRTAVTCYPRCLLNVSDLQLPAGAKLCESEGD